MRLTVSPIHLFISQTDGQKAWGNKHEPRVFLLNNLCTDWLFLHFVTFSVSGCWSKRWLTLTHGDVSVHPEGRAAGRFLRSVL